MASGANPAWNGMSGAYQQKNPGYDVMNRDTMTSPQAGAARQRSAEIMNALRNGNEGDADAMMKRSTADKSDRSTSKVPGKGSLIAKLFSNKRGEKGSKE